MFEAALAGNSSSHGKHKSVASDYVIMLVMAEIMIIYNACSCISSQQNQLWNILFCGSPENSLSSRSLQRRDARSLGNASKQGGFQ